MVAFLMELMTYKLKVVLAMSLIIRASLTASGENALRKQPLRESVKRPSLTESDPHGEAR